MFHVEHGNFKTEGIDMRSFLELTKVQQKEAIDSGYVGLFYTPNNTGEVTKLMEEFANGLSKSKRADFYMFMQLQQNFNAIASAINMPK